MRPPLPPVEVWEETDSTNRIVAAWLVADCAHGRALRARRQTAGRGRLGRTWIAEPNSGLALSIALPGPAWFAVAPRIPLAAGVACATVLEQRYGISVKLKWPNDLIVGGRKLGGILCEGVNRGSTFAGVVVGLGVNINETSSSFPELLRDSATSARIESGRTEDDLDTLATLVRDAVVAEAAALADGASAQLLERWAALDGIRGRTVWFEEQGGVRSGLAAGIAPDGALRVETEEGCRLLHAGEVTTQPPTR